MAWIEVTERMPDKRDENCCLVDEDEGRYTIPLLVWDEDNADYHIASYDFKEARWDDIHAAEGAAALTGVTHWQELPEPPEGM